MKQLAQGLTAGVRWSSDSNSENQIPRPPCHVPVQGRQTLSELAHENPAGTRKILLHIILCAICMTLHQIHK